MASEIGQSLRRDLEAAALLMQRRFGVMAARELPSAMELDYHARAMLPSEHASLYLSMVLSFAPFYVRSSQEARDLLQRHSELDATNCESAGTYLIVLDCGSEGMFYYVGSAYGGTIARRMATHARKLSKVGQAEADEDDVELELEGEDMGLLYREGVVERHCCVLTRGPEGLTDREMSEWLRWWYPLLEAGRGLERRVAGEYVRMPHWEELDRIYIARFAKCPPGIAAQSPEDWTASALANALATPADDDHTGPDVEALA